MTGGARTFGAILHGCAVARAVASSLHALIDEHDLAADRRSRQSIEGIQRRDFENLGFDAILGGPDAAAERDRNQRLRDGPGKRDLGVTAHPARDQHVLRANVREAETAELVERPAHGRGVAARARGPWPDFCHQ